jgi:hypothetical protein
MRATNNLKEIVKQNATREVSSLPKNFEVVEEDGPFLTIINKDNDARVTLPYCTAGDVIRTLSSLLN